MPACLSPHAVPHTLSRYAIPHTLSLYAIPHTLSLNYIPQLFATINDLTEFKLFVARGLEGLSPSVVLMVTPYTLHPTPYTLHPTPYTLHPNIAVCSKGS